MFLTSPVESSIHNTDLSSENVILSESGEKYAPFTSKAAKMDLNSISVDFDVRGQQRMDFFIWGSSLLWCFS